MKQLLRAIIFLMPALALAESAALPAFGSMNTTVASSDYAAMREAEAMRSWKRSLVPMAATQGFDVASSYGMRELNPLLAGGDGRFGVKAAGIKVGTAAAVVGIEYLIVKKWPGVARVFSKLNWGSSALTGAIAAHNFAIK